MKLSRLHLSGTIDFNTPWIVLNEISQCHGLNLILSTNSDHSQINNVLCQIYQNAVPEVPDELTTNILPYIARFVNPNTNWFRNQLIKAYNYLLLFINTDDYLSLLKDNFISGLQTPDNPYNINSCILYNICRNKNIYINYYTTFDQLNYAVKLLLMGSYQLEQIFSSHTPNTIDMINYLLHQNNNLLETNSINNYYQIPTSNTNYNILSELQISLFNVKTLQKNIEPRTYDSAIALSALIYQVDLSWANNPLLEYKLLRKEISYSPYDSWMAFWYKINPDLFNLNINFNPLFPQDYYPEQTLQALAHNEGYNERETRFNNLYELLQIAYYSDTFYDGIYPQMNTTISTILLENIEQLPRGQVLGYGNRAGLIHPITIIELSELLKNNQNFTNPFDRDSIFSEISINKLKSFLKYRNQYDLETISLRQQLYQLIKKIETVLKAQDINTQKFLRSYNNLKRSDQEHILMLLTNLLHIGFYMRGWLGPDQPFPIVRAEVPYELEAQVNLNVFNSLIKYQQLSEQNPVSELVNNLPLVRFRGGEYQNLIDDNDGLTIKGRLEIVKQGDSSVNIASCIRLSSNIICATAYKYLTVLHHPIDFKIEDLREIQ